MVKTSKNGKNNCENWQNDCENWHNDCENWQNDDLIYNRVFEVIITALLMLHKLVKQW